MNKLTACGFAAILGAAAFAACGPAAALERFAIDKAHSSFVFSVNHLGFSNVFGRFADFVGEFAFDPANIGANTVKVSIKSASIDTLHQRRDDHLRSPDFFNAKEFPEVVFVSTKVEKTGEKTGKVFGELTMLGVTKPVTLDVTFNRMAEHPLPAYNKVLTAGFSARTVIKRSDWGMKYGTPNLGDEVTLYFEVEGAKKS